MPSRQRAARPPPTRGRRPVHDAGAPHPGTRYPAPVGKLLLLFIAVPLLDLWLLLQIGRALGPWSTVALLLATGMAGAWLAKAEGFRVIHAWQRALAEGRVPEEGILSGALVLAGGLLLVAPGVITDVLGVVLLAPPTRRLVAAGLRRWLRRQIASGRVRVVRHGWEPSRGDEEEIDVTPRADAVDADRLPGER